MLCMAMMNEYLEEAKEELKRVDHIIFVSLKYTRTVDVIRNALHRMVSAFEYIIDGLLLHLQQQGEVEAVPKNPRAKVKMLHQVRSSTPPLQKYLTFYQFLRELCKAPYTRRDEYRRHVTMIAELGNRTAEIDIDLLEDEFDRFAKGFLTFVEEATGVARE